jgi:hypothetical protein
MPGSHASLTRFPDTKHALRAPHVQKPAFPLSIAGLGAGRGVPCALAARRALPRFPLLPTSPSRVYKLGNGARHCRPRTFHAASKRLHRNSAACLFGEAAAGCGGYAAGLPAAATASSRAPGLEAAAAGTATAKGSAAAPFAEQCRAASVAAGRDVSAAALAHSCCSTCRHYTARAWHNRRSHRDNVRARS